MAGIKATPQEIIEVTPNENLSHYVWLAGGPQAIFVGGIGESAVGFHEIPRRTIREVIPIKYGARVENSLGEESLSNPNMDKIVQNWHLDPRRVLVKSAKAICTELQSTWAVNGLVVLHSLTGKDFTKADELVDSIISSDITQRSLTDVLQHLRSLSFSLDDPRFRTHSEMLSGAERAYTYLFDHVQNLKTEVGAAMQAGRPMRPLGPVEKELFVEVAETLPEDLSAKRNAELGVQIARSVSETSGVSNNDALVKILEKMDERLAALETREIETSPSEVTATAADKPKSK
jgi:hypothetical protein